MAGLIFDPTTSANWRAFQNGDLPSSGVTAATYGDSTHVAQVAVNAQGIVTGASNVAISGGSGTIGDITSSSSTITVTNPTGPTTNVDLPTSGVAAGTYGSSTQVAQVAVNSRGIVTSASNVSISGIAGTGLVKLFDSTLGSAAATIDTGAGGVAGGHGDLTIYIISRTAAAATSDTLNLILNNDTGSNYRYEYVQAVGASSSAGNSNSTGQSAIGCITVGDNATANWPGSAVLIVPSYDQTTFNKVGTVELGRLDVNSSVAAWATRRMSFNWDSTTAISRVAISAASGSNLKAGTRMVIYGAQ